MSEFVLVNRCKQRGGQTPNKVIKCHNSGNLLI